MNGTDSFEAQVARRRIATLRTEADYFARRDQLRAQLEQGLSKVATEELHQLEEACTEIEEGWEAQQRDEIAAENAWLRAAEYDPRMNDPREW